MDDIDRGDFGLPLLFDCKSKIRSQELGAPALHYAMQAVRCECRTLFGVGGEPDDPTMAEEDEGVVDRQRRADDPRNVRASRHRFIGRQPT